MKKMYFIFSVLLMVILLNVPWQNAKAQTVWNGTTDVSWYVASQHSFNISTGEQLAGLAYLVNQNIDDFNGDTINLVADIWLNYNGFTTNNWVPIGGSPTATAETSGGTIRYFHGNFFGHQHTIYNMYCNKSAYFQAGFFGCIRGVKIKNLALVNPTVTSKGMMGALAGFADGGAVTINDCMVINAHITGTGGNNIGCFVGANYGNASGTTVTSCGATGTITGSYPGGFGGNCQYETFTNCYFAGSITGSPMGGITAYGGTRTNCYSDVTAVGDGNSATVMTDSAMRASSFIASLDSTFKLDPGINNGFPVKTWMNYKVLVEGNRYLCTGETTTLTAHDSTATYAWSTGATTNTITVSPTTTTNYTVTCTNTSNTTYIDTITVTVYPQAVITATAMTSSDGIAHGSVTPETSYVGCGSANTVAISITPDANWHISQIVVNDSVVRGMDPNDGSVVSYTVNPNGTLCDVKVYFDNHYDLTLAIQNTLGTTLTLSALVTPSTTPVTVIQGSNYTYKFKSTVRYHLNNILVDGVTQTLADSLQLTDIQNPHAITVVYADTCGIFSLPITENFDISTYNIGTSTSTMADCWSNVTSLHATYPHISTSQIVSTPNGLSFYTYTSMLVSPMISSTIPVNTMQVSWKMRWSAITGGAFVVGVMTSPTDTGTFVALDTFRNTVASTFQSHIAYLNHYTGSGQYIALKWIQSGSVQCYIDDIVLDYAPSCSPILNLTADTPTYTSADAGTDTLSWIDGLVGTTSDYLIEYKPGGDTTWASVTTNTTTYALTGLNPITNYDVRVSRNCGTDGYSETVATTFYTPCDSADQCAYSFKLTGSSSYSWYYGGSLNVYIDGHLKQNLTLAYGTTNQTFSIPVCNNSNVEVKFSLNYSYYASGMSWTITDPFNETAISGTGSSFSNGATIASFTGNCTAPICRRPINLTLTAATTNSADVSWTNADENGSEWLVTYGPSGFALDTGATMTVSAMPCQITGLNPNTAYDVYVTSVCGAGDTSLLSAKYTFRTECAALDSLPYTMNFDNPSVIGQGAHNLPYCWTFNNAGTAGANYPFANYDYSASHSHYYYIHSNVDVSTAGYASQYLILPSIDPSVANINQTLVSCYVVRAWASAQAVVVVGAMSNPYDTTTFEAVDTINCTSSGSNYTYYEIPMSSYTGTGTYIAFKLPKLAAQNAYNMDDISVSRIPDCIAPNNVVVSQISTTSAQVAWTERGTATSWEIEYDTTGFTPGTGTILTVTENPYTLMNLNTAAAYDVYVKSICSFTNSDATGLFTFYTAVCDSLERCNYTFNLHDSYGDGWNGNQIKVYQNGILVSSLTLPSGSDASYEIPLCEDVPVSLVWSSGSYSSETSFNMMDPFGESTLYSCSDGSTLTNGATFYTDTVDCTPPACPSPNNITVSGSTISTANVAWNERGTATQWTLAYSTVSNFNPDSVATTVVATTNPYTITGLTANTAYYVSVKADCDSSSSSRWSAIQSFRTGCGAITTLPYFVNFDNPSTIGQGIHNLPFCWSYLNTGTLGTNYPYVNLSYGAGYSGSYYVHSNVDTMSAYSAQYLILPAYDLTTVNIDQLQVSCYVKKAWSGTQAVIEVGVMSDPNDTTTFVPVDTINGTDSYVQYTTLLNTYTGSGAYIAFKLPHLALQNAYNMDDIRVELIPGCPTPSNLTLTASSESSLTISWTDSVSANWTIEYGTSSFNTDNATAPAVTVLTSNTNSITLTGLNSNTSYYVAVKGDCNSNTASQWSAVSTFRTDCGPITSIPYTMNFDQDNISAYHNLPGCVSYLNMGTNGANYPYANYNYSASHSHYYYVHGNVENLDGWGDQYLIMPAMDATIAMNQLQVSFYLADAFSSPCIAQVEVGVMSSATDTSTFIPVQTVNTTSQSYSQFTVSLGSYTGAGSIVAFRLKKISVHNAYNIDDIVMDYITCTTPTGLVANNVTSTDANLSWTAGGTETQWTVAYKTLADADFTEVTVNTTPSQALANLTPATTYIVKVKANCTATVTSAYSDTIHFTTLNNVVTCNAPTNVAASNITETGATITWTAGGTETQWILEYKTSTASTYTTVNVATTPSYALTGLAAGTAYDVRVKAVCDATSQSDYSTVYNFTTTQPQECPVPTNLHTTAVDVHTATLAWDQSGTATSWEINYKRADATTWTVSTTTTNPYQIVSLDSNTTYEAQVRAICGTNDYSDFTSVLSFTTIVGINDYTLSNLVKIYPNPTNNNLNIVSSNANIQVEEAGVYDVYGKKIIGFSMEDSHAVINVSSLSAGIYFVRMISDKGIIVKQFIKR